MHPAKPREQAFTLVEMALVLVIIGITAGGVLFARDLMAAAQTRAQLSQIEQFSSLTKLFKGKYNALPGDMTPQLAQQFGLAPRSGAAGHGDGNGAIESCAVDASWQQSGCETALFWRDLSETGMLQASFQAAGDMLSTISPGNASAYFPEARIGRNSSVIVFTDLGQTGRNYFSVAVVQGTDVFGSYNTSYALTPAESWGIDVKTDDGYPISGHIKAGDVHGNLGWSSAFNCSNILTNQYYLADSNSSTPGCHLIASLQ